MLETQTAVKKKEHAFRWGTGWLVPDKHNS